ncbi:MAG: SxtJ family membrane protein [Alphaproteobacteria bacterium]|nr:SxtJ family membrane protein [Alphaproteobacteria bacterium]
MSTHEDYVREESIEGSTDRGFGLTVGGILLAIGLVRIGLGWWSSGAFLLGWVEWLLCGVGAVLVVFGLIAPSILAPLNRGWTKLGLILFKVVNPIVLGLIFLLTIVPIGLLLRAFGKDPLRLKFDADAKSYWIPRDPPGPTPDSMPQQF